MNEVHGPHFIRTRRRAAALSQLRLHPALRRGLAQLQPQLPLKPIDTRRIHAPAFPSQQHMDTPIAVAHPRLGNLLHPFLQVGLIRMASTIMVARPFRPKHAARPSDADDPGASKIIDELPAPIRCQNFRLTASCNIALSSDKSATNGLSFAVSSSSCRSRRISDGISPAYFLRHA